MTLINEDQIEGEFPTVKLGIPPFASDGVLRFGKGATTYIRNNANDDDIEILNHGGGAGADTLRFLGTYWIIDSADQGTAVEISGGLVEDADVNGGPVLISGGGGGDGGGGGVTILGGNGVVAGGVVSLSAGNATDDSTAGGGLEIGTGVGKGVPVASIQFLTAGSEAVASDAQTLNLRGTMADEVLTWDGVIKLTPRAFADLPATPTEGMMAWVNDSSTATWGATIAGGGANKVLAVFNGTVWTVAAK